MDESEEYVETSSCREVWENHFELAIDRCSLMLTNIAENELLNQTHLRDMTILGLDLDAGAL